MVIENELHLTIAVGYKQFVANRLNTSTTSPLTIPYAFEIKDIFLDTLTAEIGAINIVIVNQMRSTFATF
jgi:hypothetical protein